MISVVLPAYEEEKNLINILPRIHKVLDSKKLEHEILVVDTMEPLDDTKKVCEQYNARYVPRENGNYYGDAIRTGFDKAVGEYIVVMDADGSHDPKEILKFYKVMKNPKVDLVIGSRYCKGGHTDNNFVLRFMSWALNVTYRVFFALKVRDVSDSFRMYRSSQVKNLQFECENFDIVEEILIKLSLYNKPFIAVEVPISFNKRAEGESKRDLGKFILSYLKTIKRLMRIKRESRKQR